MGEIREQDAGSGLVEREWVRLTKRRGKLTEGTLEGEPIETIFLDRHGGLRHTSGTVRRNEQGELVVESRADGLLQQTPVPRDANVRKVPGR